MVQQGCEGLLYAYRNYDPTKYDVKFWTYAEYFVFGQMKDYIKKSTNIIRPSNKINQLAMKIRKLDLWGKSSDDIAAILGCSRKMAIMAKSFLRDRNVASLQRKVVRLNTEEGNLELGDIVPSNMDDYNDAIISDFLETLTQNEKELLFLKMEGYKFNEIKKVTGLQLAEIESIEKSLIMKHESYYQHKYNESEEAELTKLTQKNAPLLTKAEYTKLKQSGLSNEEIAVKKKISKSMVNRYSQKWKNEIESKSKEDVKDQVLTVSVNENKESEHIRREMEIIQKENFSLKERLTKLQEEINLLWKMQDILRSKIWD
ncbi:hypothetical protein SD70_04035 [Gordoniibacillus kamchatkensis]|uniref:RNA polymerase sigma factor SigS n=1 Tax=Gordoniibacillus kamchatkensis TaxID=1590651 RepID=A0ABR5ALY1_9BACL|nr:hypothetical protein SD70_04035 [Paenibacillus sp. VKM B-2647]